MMEMFMSLDTWVGLLTLSIMEIVLGIDNIIFISILCSRLPENQKDKARRYGLIGAFLTRIFFLSLMVWLAGLVKPLFSIGGIDFSVKSIVLLGGGVFLVYKATTEIHHKLELPTSNAENYTKSHPTFFMVILQIILLDIVFSIDSVITAVGMSRNIFVMIAANIIALIIMIWVGKPIGEFVEKHPSVKMLALAFLLLIGVLLLAEGMGQHVPKGYVYFAMGFSVFVELLNLKAKHRIQ